MPQLQISKTEDGDSCKAVIQVSVPPGPDRRGNYVHIAFVDRSGQIIGRIDQSQRNEMYQAGYTSSMTFPLKDRCVNVVGVKVYSFALARPDGGLYPGFDRYNLKLEGLESR